MSELPEHVARNRSCWNRLAAEYVEDGRRKWAAAEPSWGIWDVPESELGVLPGERRRPRHDRARLRDRLRLRLARPPRRESGLQVEELIEVRPPAGSTTRYPWMKLEWARQWPCEEVWRARRTGDSA